MNLQLFALKDKVIIMANDGGGSPTKKEEKKDDTNTNKSSGYDPYSITDYLKQQGQDSSYSARKKLAEQMGITGYKGSGEQNTQLLKMLKEGSKPSTPATNVDNKPSKQDKPAVVDKPAVADPVVTVPPQASPVLQGVDSSLVDTMNTTFAPSAGVTDAQAQRDEALNKLNSMPTPSVSADVMQALNTPFNASSAYLEAMNYTNSLLEKLSSGRTSYTDQIKDMMNKIQNRDKFSYDVDTDVLFQQALASAMGSGKQAMQDTMGQASALTGGYASTYAQSAGNQAYNAYIEDAYNNLPEYYQMALEAYNMEGQDMYNQLSMLSDADATEYGRMYDSWNANFTQAQNMYNQEYGAWQDSVNNAYNNANLQLKEQGMAYDQAYTNYNALSNQAQTLYQNEYTKWQDMVNNAYNQAQMQNKDYWSGVDNQYRYDVIASNEEQARLDREQEDEWNQKEYDYKYEMLDRDDAQFTARYDINGDGVVDANDQKVEETSTEEEYKTPDAKTYDLAVEAYNTGGEAGLMAFLEKYPDYDVTALYDYAVDHGTIAPEASAFTKVDDTINGFWGIDHNDVVVDVNTGIEYKVSDLPKDMQKQLTDLKEGETFDFATGKVIKEEEKKVGKNKLVLPSYGKANKGTSFTTVSMK